MSSKMFILVLILILLSFGVQAQEVKTLNDCMQYAIEHSPKTQKKAAENKILADDYRDAVMGFVPEISGGVGAATSFGRSVDPETNIYANYTNFNNSYSLEADYTLFNGFSTVNNYKIAKNAKEMGVVESQQLEDEICLKVIQAYYNVLYFMEMSDLVQKQLIEAQNNLKLTQKQEQQGLKGYADVAEIEASVAEKDYELIKMQNNYANALSVLKQIMFFPMEETLEIFRDSTIQLDDASSDVYKDNLIAQAKNTLPSALIAKNNITKAQLNYKTSKWSLLPSLSAIASYSTNYVTAFDDSYAKTPFFDQLKDRQGEYVQLYLRIPILTGLQRQTNINRTKNRLRIAEYEYEDQLKSIEVEVELAIQDKDGALKAFIQADKRVNAQKVAYNLNAKRYEQGIISALDLQSSSNNLLSAEAERLNMFFQYNIKYRVVQYYKGIPYIEQ